MALLFFDGFEGGLAKPEWASLVLPSSAGARTGAGYMGSTGNILNITPSAVVTTGFAVVAYTSFRGVTSRWIWQARGDSGATIHLTLTLDATGLVQLRLGSGTGTVLATSANPLDPTVWTHVQVQASIADTGGRCIVKVDNITVIDYTGDTKNAGTSTNIDQLRFDGDTGSGGSLTRWDDLWVTDGVDATATQGRANSGFLGDLAVQALYPSGDGAANQWLGSDGNSVQNYLLVDEVGGPNTTDYVGSSTSGQQDLYELPDLPTNATAVYGVRTAAYVAKSDAGAIGLRTLIREASGTVTAEATPTLSTTFAKTFGPQRFVKPGSTATWSVADVNGLQVGVDVV